MYAIIFAQPKVRQLKSLLRSSLPEAKSSHLSEAIASALGFRTYASLLAELNQTDETFPKSVFYSDAEFTSKMIEFGYSASRWTGFNEIEIPEDLLIPIERGNVAQYKYNSPRKRAWRNLMVAAINAGLSQRLFSIIPEDNRWPGFKADQHVTDKGHTYNFLFENAVPAKAHVNDAGFGELSIQIALWPYDDGRFVGTFNGGFYAGEAYATGWFERKLGAWLQSSTSSFSCRRHLVEMIAAHDIVPLGFGEKGRVIL